jgi:hypothetical protein
MYCDVLEGGPRRGRQYAKHPTSARNDTTVNSDDVLLLTVIQPPSVLSEEAPREAGTSTGTITKPLEWFQCYG